MDKIELTVHEFMTIMGTLDEKFGGRQSAAGDTIYAAWLEQWRVLDHRKELISRLATIVMKRMVLRSGTIRCGQLKGVKLGVMDAAPFLHWHLPLARKRGWPYWTLPINGRS